MQVKSGARAKLNNLHYLPGYAEYLLVHRLQEFSEVSLRLSREEKLPMLNLLAHLPPEELLELTIRNNVGLLEALTRNSGQAYIEEAIRRFRTNSFSGIENKEVMAEDITLACYIRKQALLHFLPDYCSTMQEALDVVRDIDIYILEYETSLANEYAGLLQKRIEDRNLFIQKVANTLPGAVYIFDLEQYKNIYATDKLVNVLGYSNQELDTLGGEAITALIHEEDRAGIRDHMLTLPDLEEGEICSYKYRIRLKSGAYRWIRIYETPFKRDEHGKVCQTIAIALDVDKEKRIADELKVRERELLDTQELYKQAQAISQVGHYSLDLETREIYLTEEASRIYGFEATVNRITYNDLIPFRHPEDYDHTQQTIQHTIETHEPFDFYYRIINKNGLQKTIHTLGKIVFDEDGRATHLVGTIQDVTDRHALLQRLQLSETHYKQAQALAHIGNWYYDLATETFTWSEEMYRIFGLPMHEVVNLEKWLQAVHPDDREEVLAYWEACVREKRTYDARFRIVLPDGSIKKLHRKGEIIF
ncbi:MAG TPA: PAS domain-containing protein, partial [Flavisolibacter sp.]